MSLLFLILAIVLAVWAALVDAGHINIGVYAQLLALAVACLAAAAIPWSSYWRR